MRGSRRPYDKVAKVRKNGYLEYALYNAQGVTYWLAHRLVAETFITNPECKPCVNHINGDKTDNRAVNLEWVTWHENTQHGLDTGLLTVGEARYNAKLTEGAVRAIRASSDELRILAHRYGVSMSAVWNAKHRVSWKHVI